MKSRKLQIILLVYYKRQQNKQHPQWSTKKDGVNIALEIMKLLAEKRKARAKLQRSRTPSDKTTFNMLSSILKSQLKVMRTNSFKNYVSTLSRYDNSTWKPIKSPRKPILASSSLRLETSNPERWARSDKEKAAVFAKHLADVFQPQEQDPDEEMLEFLELPAQAVEPIKHITPKEINDEIGLLNTKKNTWHGLNNFENVKGITLEMHGFPRLLI